MIVNCEYITISNANNTKGVRNPVHGKDEVDNYIQKDIKIKRLYN
jgi:hypothetical protein